MTTTISIKKKESGIETTYCYLSIKSKMKKDVSLQDCMEYLFRNYPVKYKDYVLFRTSAIAKERKCGEKKIMYATILSAQDSKHNISFDKYEAIEDSSHKSRENVVMQRLCAIDKEWWKDCEKEFFSF